MYVCMYVTVLCKKLDFLSLYGHQLETPYSKNFFKIVSQLTGDFVLTGICLQTLSHFYLHECLTHLVVFLCCKSTLQFHRHEV